MVDQKREIFVLLYPEMWGTIREKNKLGDGNE